jgi:uncharacterized protein YPO0396
MNHYSITSIVGEINTSFGVMGRTMHHRVIVAEDDLKAFFREHSFQHFSGNILNEDGSLGEVANFSELAPKPVGQSTDLALIPASDVIVHPNDTSTAHEPIIVDDKLKANTTTDTPMAKVELTTEQQAAQQQSGNNINKLTPEEQIEFDRLQAEETAEANKNILAVEQQQAVGKLAAEKLETDRLANEKLAAEQAAKQPPQE